MIRPPNAIPEIELFHNAGIVPDYSLTVTDFRHIGIKSEWVVRKRGGDYSRGEQKECK